MDLYHDGVKGFGSIDINFQRGHETAQEALAEDRDARYRANSIQIYFERGIGFRPVENPVRKLNVEALHNAGFPILSVTKDEWYEYTEALRTVGNIESSFHAKLINRQSMTINFEADDGAEKEKGPETEAR